MTLLKAVNYSETRDKIFSLNYHGNNNKSNSEREKKLIKLIKAILLKKIKIVLRIKKKKRRVKLFKKKKKFRQEVGVKLNVLLIRRNCVFYFIKHDF